jgi:hypothetical protein
VRIGQDVRRPGRIVIGIARIQQESCAVATIAYVYLSDAVQMIILTIEVAQEQWF